MASAATIDTRARPGGESVGRSRILTLSNGDGRASFDAVGENCRSASTNGIGEQVEDARKAGLCVDAPGEDVEGTGEERSLLMCLAVLGASRADPAIDEQRWGRNDRGAGGQPGLAGRVARRSTILHRAALLANPPSGSAGTPEVPVLSRVGCSG